MQANFGKLRSSRREEPEFCVAVSAAEAAGVVDVLQGHQPLQRVHGLQARDARLPRRCAELLKAQQ